MILVWGITYIGCVYLARVNINNLGLYVFWQCISAIFLMFLSISILNIFL